MSFALTTHYVDEVLSRSGLAPEIVLREHFFDAYRFVRNKVAAHIGEIPLGASLTLDLVRRCRAVRVLPWPRNARDVPTIHCLGDIVDGFTDVVQRHWTVHHIHPDRIRDCCLAYLAGWNRCCVDFQDDSWTGVPAPVRGNVLLAYIERCVRECWDMMAGRPHGCLLLTPRSAAKIVMTTLLRGTCKCSVIVHGLFPDLSPNALRGFGRHQFQICAQWHQIRSYHPARPLCEFLDLAVKNSIGTPVREDVYRGMLAAVLLQAQ